MWYQEAIFYELYVRAFKDSDADGNGDLEGIVEKLDYIEGLGVDCIWLLPIYPSPGHDDGYDISDYYDINPEYGTLEDFDRLIEEAHSRNLKVITDLVVNHTSSDHPWFQASRDPSHPEHEKYKDYYVWHEAGNLPYKDARIIFLDTEESNWTYDTLRGEYFWHRFYKSQPDLNYENPEVQEEMLKVIDFWLERGIDGFRVDAVPYLFEREGTDGENLPETHQYVKRLRKHLDEKYSHAMILAEANQPPHQVVDYFGEGDEFHMAFHFPMMPYLFMSLRLGDPAPLVRALNNTPSIPQETQWATFLRNHDELTLEMVTDEEREWMWEQYAPNPEWRINLGIRRRLASLLDDDDDKIMLANHILFSMPGSPVIYYGDEIGMGDLPNLDDRYGVRTPMQWIPEEGAGFSEAQTYLPVINGTAGGVFHRNVEDQLDDEGSLLNRMKRIIGKRKEYAELFALGSIEIPKQKSGMLAYKRSHEGIETLVMHNLGGESIIEDIGPAYDFLNEEEIPGEVVMKPYQTRWIIFK